MTPTGKHVQNNIAMATIERIEQVDFLLITQLHIWFVLSGYLEIMRNGSDILIRTGDIFVLNKGDIVRVVRSEENATLTVKLLTSEYEEEPPSFKLNIPLSMVYKKDGYELIKLSMAYLYIEMTYPVDGSTYMIEGYVKRLIGLLYRYLEQVDGRELTHNASDKLKQIISFINANYAEKISLDELAERFFSSKYYLAHSFKKQLGISIGNYIKEVRLFHSYLMLEGTNEKIVTIALSNGFPNVRAFNESFKAKYQRTPAQFREERKLAVVQKRTDEVLSQDIFELLSPYVSLGDLSAAPPPIFDRFEVQVDVQKTIGRYSKVNHVLKVKGELSSSRLLEVRQRIGVKWVAVTRIFKLIHIQMVDDKLVCSFRELDRVLQQIVAAGMHPYFQFQTIDYTDWGERGFHNHGCFQTVITELSLYLQQNYMTSQDWMYEFRCFYEFENSGELCLPLVDAITPFKGYANLVIHFPVPPDGAVSLNEDYQNAVYCIDDWTYVRKISLEAALDALFDERYIQIISENANMKAQDRILDRMLGYEHDDYLHVYSDLVQANSSVWQSFNLLNQNEDASHFFSPLSLDSAKLFEYFPDELASKLSLCTLDGRYKDNWYAAEFVSRLYGELVFRNESCMITKRQDNYRILIVYPEQDLRLFFHRKNEQPESTWKKAKSPYVSVKLELKNLDGMYRLIKQQLTPELINQRTDVAELRKCRKLSLEDVSYWNAINRPSRSVETLYSKGQYTLEFDVPSFGIMMIDLEKTNNEG
ncbi:helix-turn-helix transcriptional regulator [Paenibacillus agilis]|uniref:Helix-turn-helix transcriptional regulator n=1 Tax=Paenibacillus agilis TaxID=3020863 RepID=A0A559IQ41_9BACL|nr:AraC family transcriptional regulator [Paenibacillus agilis]TVX89767.1 helix-turn-helix transcriptional regulator [Paenibacillus agilis]